MSDKSPATARPTPLKNEKGQFVSKYDPEVAVSIIEKMTEGYTITACSGLLKVHRDTIYHWENTIPEFKYALSLGRAARQAFWEKKLIDANLPVKITAAIFALKNANPAEWNNDRPTLLPATGEAGTGRITEFKITFVDPPKEIEHDNSEFSKIAIDVESEVA